MARRRFGNTETGLGIDRRLGNSCMQLPNIIFCTRWNYYVYCLTLSWLGDQMRPSMSLFVWWMGVVRALAPTCFA